MSKIRKILVVDDEPNIRQVVRFALEKAGFEVAEADNGKEAIDSVNSINPDLIVLDVMMPEMDGTEACKAIRKTSDVPILFLSSMDSEIDKILGLELGGDDYITKPFSPRELVARIKAVFRRIDKNERPSEKNNAPDTGKALTHGKLSLDPDLHQASWEGVSVNLTSTEFMLLRTMLGYPGKVFTRDELMDGAYGLDSVVTDRTIDSHIRRIRKKFGRLKGEPIQTVHGVGYKLGSCE